MMKLKHALVLAALTAGAAIQAAETEPIVITVTSENGTWTGNGNYCSRWTSNANPGVVIDCGVNNFNYTSQGPLVYNSGLSQASTFTISATTGYYVQAYSFKAAKTGAWETITYNANNKGAVTITQEPQTFSVSGLTEYDTAAIAVSGANKPVELTDFTVTIAKRQGSDPGSLVTTTITNGKFADDTQWYTMAIGAQQYLFSDTNIDGYMPLNSSDVTGMDNQLWCITGNETDGFQFYNKAAGTSVMLSAPANPASLGTNGGTAYVILADPTEETTRTYDWQMTESSNLSRPSFYIYVKGKTAQKINNRDQRLAFWTAGADAGSSVTFTPYRPSIGETAEGNVWTISTSPSITVVGPAGATASMNNNTVTLSEGEWVFNTPTNQIIAKSTILKGDNSVETHVTNGFDNSFHTITGPAVIKNISYTLMNPLEMPASGFPVFITTGQDPFNVGYRIPAITTVAAGPYKGRIVTLNDYRYCGGDIGAGRIDIYMSYSDNNGDTWSEPGHMYGADGQPVAMGNGSAQKSDGNGIIIEGLDCGYGDPAIVSDRESGEILAIACAGRMNFFSSTRENPQPSVRWWSSDGGQTWTKPDDGQYKQIYALLGEDAAGGPIKSQFIGSGRMVQSRHIKVGTHYRVYCVNSGRAVSDNTLRNWVLYTDDFGKNWKVLGGAGKPGVTSGADEPKCEELPDGSILLAARGNGGNRNFNIFRYTDIENGEGDWMSHFNTNMGMGNINACNGEIMILPAKNKETGEKHYIALQSFPYGGGRNNVSIAWKSLANPSDYDEPSDFANWNGRYQVSYIGSAYSTMTLTADNQIGFIFEEGTYAGGNTGCEIYKKISIETITGDQYEYCADDDFSLNKQASADMMQHRLNVATANKGEVNDRIVGTRIPATHVPEEVTNAINEFNSSETYNYNAIVKFNNALAEFMNSMEVVEPVDGATYRIKATNHPSVPGEGTLYMTVNSAGKLTVTENADDEKNVFVLVKDPDAKNPDAYFFYNPASDKVLPKSHASTNTEMNAVGKAYNSAPYEIEIAGDGLVGIKSTQAGNQTYPYLHYAGNNRIVIWGLSGSVSSQWVMEQTGMADPAPSVEIYKVTVSPSELILEAGAESSLRSTILPTYKGKTATWTSDNETVATVDADGKVTAVRAGTAVITATVAEGYTDSCTVTVNGQTGIEEITEANGEAEILYDLQGRRVTNAGKGIYVTGSGQKVRL